MSKQKFDFKEVAKPTVSIVKVAEQVVTLRTTFKYRISDHIKKHTTVKHQNYQFPSSEKLSYESHIIGFMHNPDLQWHGMNVLMSDGR